MNIQPWIFLFILFFSSMSWGWETDQYTYRSHFLIDSLPLLNQTINEGLEEIVDEVVIGNTGNPEDAANISRIIALEVGIPKEVPAYTVHRNCASAMEAVSQGFLKIKAGLADTVVVGGTESMSNMPLLYSKEMRELFSSLMTAKNCNTKAICTFSFSALLFKTYYCNSRRTNRCRMWTQYGTNC